MNLANVARTDKKLQLIGIPAIVIINMLLHPREHALFSVPFWIYLVVGTLITFLIWSGCRQIVIFLWKRFPWHKNAAKHLLIEVPSVLSWSTLVVILVFSITEMMGPQELPKGAMLDGIVGSAFITLFVTSIYEGVFFFFQWKESMMRSEKLERANLQAQYETLKTQINPHFLFNSLNTLMGYIEENPKATEFAQNLSDFLRYVLKSRNSEVVLLRDEIEIANKYVFLQSTRFGPGLVIDMDIPETYHQYAIAPLALQMLLENAVKHNVKSRDKPLEVSVYIENNNWIVVENKLQRREVQNENTGMGLVNIKNRYRFLSNREVRIEEDEHYFRVKLPLLNVDL